MTAVTTAEKQQLGERTRLALAITRDWQAKSDARRLLVLLAACADAGVTQPLARKLADRLGIAVRPNFDLALIWLARERLIWVVRDPRRSTGTCCCSPATKCRRRTWSAMSRSTQCTTRT